MNKCLIRLVLLVLPIAALVGGSDAVPGSSDTYGDRSADVCWQVERPADSLFACLHPGAHAGGFPFCATKSILRWREAPVHKARQSPPAPRWL